MVGILGSSTDSCVVVKFSGKVTGEEYRQFLDAVDERLKANQKINMVAELSEFEFYGDFEAFKEDFHFGVKEYRKVARAAFVGDQRWIEMFIKLLGPLYRAAEKQFSAGRLDEAVAWATAPEGPDD
jgi:hypothetical protein